MHLPCSVLSSFVSFPPFPSSFSSFSPGLLMPWWKVLLHYFFSLLLTYIMPSLWGYSSFSFSLCVHFLFIFSISFKLIVQLPYLPAVAVSCLGFLFLYHWSLLFSPNKGNCSPFIEFYEEGLQDNTSYSNLFPTNCCNLTVFFHLGSLNWGLLSLMIVSLVLL